MSTSVPAASEQSARPPGCEPPAPNRTQPDGFSGLLELDSDVLFDPAGIQPCPQTLAALGLANLLSQGQVVRHDVPRTLRVKDTQFGAIEQERADTAQVVRVQIDEQLLADETCAARQNGTRIPHTVEVDMRSGTLIQIGVDTTAFRRLHQAQRATVGRRQPVHERVSATDEHFHRLERRDVVESSVRRAVVARDRVFDQLFELVEGHEQAQIALWVRQSATQIARMAAGVARQARGQPSSDRAKEPLDVRALIWTVLRSGRDLTANELA